MVSVVISEKEIKRPTERFPELDLWRGLAVVGMIVYHTAYLLDFLGIISLEVQQGGWVLLAGLVQWSFLLLVGIMTALSAQRSHQRGENSRDFLRQQWRRGGIIFALGVVITLVTASAVPGLFVRFGILHCIGIGIILLSFLANRKYSAFVFALTIFFLNSIRPWLNFSGHWAYPLGFFSEKIATIDYFPLVPWLGVMALGIFLGHIFYPHHHRRFHFLQVPGKQVPGILFLSRYSLLIYLGHVPLVSGALYLWQHFLR